MSELSIDIESTDTITDKSHIPVETTNKDNNSKPHKGNPITGIEISPNGNYLVTYSKEDNSIVGWNVENIDEGQLEPDNVYNVENHYNKAYQLCVSDDKKLAYLDIDNKLKIIDMNNNNQEINLYFDKHIEPHYFTFNLNGEFILYSIYKNIIWIYSTKTTKNNKWICKKIYELPRIFDFELISISKYDKLYLLSHLNKSIYEWNILTEKSIKICDKYSSFDTRISSNGKFICLKIEDRIIIYSIELEIPVFYLDNYDTQPYNFMNYIDSGLYSLLLTLLNIKLLSVLSDDKEIPSIGIWNPIMEYYCKECENLLITPFLFDDTTKFVYRILDGYVWMIKIENIFKIRNELEEVISEMIKYSDRLIKLNNKNDIIESWNIYLDMDECDHVEQQLTPDLILEVNIDDEKIQLQAFRINYEWDLICTSNDEHYTKKIEKYRIFGIGLYNDNDIIILTTIGLFIYNFNESNKSISLKYFYHHEEKIKNELQCYPKSPLHTKWESVKDIKDKLRFLKYNVKSLSSAIEKHELEIIEDIYKLSQQ